MVVCFQSNGQYETGGCNTHATLPGANQWDAHATLFLAPSWRGKKVIFLLFVILVYTEGYCSYCWFLWFEGY